MIRWYWWSDEIDDMMIWWYDDMMIWSDDMIWWYDDMMTWRYGDMMIWWYDAMMIWWNDDMMIWWNLQAAVYKPETKYKRPHSKSVILNNFCSRRRCGGGLAARDRSPGAPAAAAAATKIENLWRQNCKNWKFEEGGASGRTSVSNSIWHRFRTHFNVDFELNLKD